MAGEPTEHLRRLTSKHVLPEAAEVFQLIGQVTREGRYVSIGETWHTLNTLAAYQTWLILRDGGGLYCIYPPKRSVSVRAWLQDRSLAERALRRGYADIDVAIMVATMEMNR